MQQSRRHAVIRTENDVRKWVRELDKIHGVALEWTEAARGATNGVADVKICVGESVFPVELKCWQMAARGDEFLAKMRREQVRYHFVFSRARVHTLLLWGSPGQSCLWALPGTRAPRKVVSRVAFADCFVYHDQASFLYDLQAGKFWSGEC